MSYEYKYYGRVKRSEKWKPYRNVCFRFAKYLDATMDKRVLLNGYDTFRCVDVCREVDYRHRFSSVYRSMLYAKFSQLEEWYKSNKMPVFLLSLTTSSRGKTIKEAFDDLRYGWKIISHSLRNFRVKYNIPVEYVYIYEPHKSGYPHMHVLLFGDLKSGDFERLKKLWSDKYGIGSYEHGFNVSEPVKHEEIKYIRAYILKYVQKSIDLDSMSTAEFVFNAVMWSFYDRSQWSWKIPYWTSGGRFAPKSTGGGAFRLWGCSASLSRVMRYEESEIDATDNFVQFARYREDIPDIVKDISCRSFEKTFGLKGGE